MRIRITKDFVASVAVCDCDEDKTFDHKFCRGEVYDAKEADSGFEVTGLGFVELLKGSYDRLFAVSCKKFVITWQRSYSAEEVANPNGHRCRFVRSAPMKKGT